MKTPLLILITSVCLTACSSPVMHSYTLQGSAPPSETPVAAPAFQLEIRPVRVPVQVDQPQLVVRLNQASLAIMENDRWGAPLAEEFHDALTDRLESRLGTHDLAGMSKDAKRPVLSIQAEVRRFDSLPGQYALEEVVWSLELRGNGQGRRTLTCATQIRQPAGVELKSLVLAHQHLIDLLAKTIADTANGWTKDAALKCPSETST